MFKKKGDSWEERRWGKKYDWENKMFSDINEVRDMFLWLDYINVIRREWLSDI